MSLHNPEIALCRKQPGATVGRLCDRCAGKCPICRSEVRPCALVHICDECNFGPNQGRCILCGTAGACDAYYCEECCMLEKDRDGCPRIINIGVLRSDLYYERHRAATGAFQ